MAFSEENGNGMVMPVTPMSGYGNGFGNGFGGDGWWILLLFILLGGNGWGNGFGGYGGGGVGYVDSSVQRGFDQSAIMSGINGINNTVVSGFGDVQTALCAGFNGVEIGANARQMADMQQMFSLQSSLQNCCCENRAGIADLKYTVATENCADRAASYENARNIIDSQTRGTQAILDKLCSLELDSKNSKIADLERQLTMANLAASQTAQTGRILADNAAQTVALEQYLNPVPVPAYVVQNPNCCTSTCGTNCGCGF